MKTNMLADFQIGISAPLNRGCLIYTFSLRFSGSKFLINLRRQFRVRKIFLCSKIFRAQVFGGFAIFLKLLFQKCVFMLIF